MLIKLGRFGELFIGKQDIIDNVMVREPHMMPHCDTRVLHVPGKCHYCDMFPEYQRYRIKAEINFTDESDPHKVPCPSLWGRTAEQRDRWSNNRPKS